ncbi:hypothetical protein [Lactococcus garvieae]|uniref:Uncharacterized protein n=1 Tax=Lactococcus garvieae TaxID=1363 RepID=A0AA46YUU7_9LACT|nr:hypothetical protein [Lactococcus garvieae]UYT10693.1 hypothetical protein OF801_01770 [Lactococcus garvieae]UYT12735.1 hypothetical protein OF800_01770 [Lactococcus garvieae]
MNSNEQRAHEVALRYTEMKFKQIYEMKKVEDNLNPLSFSEVYVEAYKLMEERLKESHRSNI